MHTHPLFASNLYHWESACWSNTVTIKLFNSKLVNSLKAIIIKKLYIFLSVIVSSNNTTQQLIHINWMPSNCIHLIPSFPLSSSFSTPELNIWSPLILKASTYTTCLAKCEMWILEFWKFFCWNIEWNGMWNEKKTHGMEWKLKLLKVCGMEWSRIVMEWNRNGIQIFKILDLQKFREMTYC